MKTILSLSLCASLSQTTVILNVGPGHPNWYQHVVFSSVYHHIKLERNWKPAEHFIFPSSSFPHTPMTLNQSQSNLDQYKNAECNIIYNHPMFEQKLFSYVHMHVDVKALINLTQKQYQGVQLNFAQHQTQLHPDHLKSMLENKAYRVFFVPARTHTHTHTHTCCDSFSFFLLSLSSSSTPYSSHESAFLHLRQPIICAWKWTWDCFLLTLN